LLASDVPLASASAVVVVVVQHAVLLAERHGAPAPHAHDLAEAHAHPPLLVQPHDEPPAHFTGARAGARSVTVS
jgi:hypothetical protein